MIDQGQDLRDKELIISLAHEAGKLAQDCRARGLDIQKNQTAP